MLNGPPLLAHLTLPTQLYPRTTKGYDPTARYLQSFFESVSALGLDLTRFVMGDLTLLHTSQLKDPDGNLAGFAAVLATQRGDLVQVTGNFAATANFSLVLNRPGRRFELLPFEAATIYGGMEVLPPDAEYPIRRYVPKKSTQISLDSIDLQEKPGFVGEAGVLLAMVKGERPPEFVARLSDALAVTTLSEQLAGVTLATVTRILIAERGILAISASCARVQNLYRVRKCHLVEVFLPGRVPGTREQFPNFWTVEHS